MKSRKLRRDIRAICSEPAVIEAAKEENSKPTFSMLAYTGGLMNVGGWNLPVVIDLSGLSLGNKNRPILRDHDARQIVGHAVSTAKSESNLRVDGIISGAGSAASEVLASGLNGFPWQASVGVEVHRVVEVAEGKTVKVNGSEFEGPLYVARKSKLYEVSFVALGADENTSASVAAEAVSPCEFLEVEKMEEETKNVEAAKTETVVQPKPAVVEAEKIDHLKLVREEQKRIAQINAACKEYPEIAAKAIEDGLSVAEAKAAMFDAIEARKGSEVGASYINVGAGAATGEKVLEAAAAMNSGAIRHGKIDAHYDEKVLDAADKIRNVGIREIIRMSCSAEGKRVEVGAAPHILAEIGFSTITVPTLLSNVANKALMDEYQSRPSLAAQLAEKLSASDFKIQTGITLGGLGRMEKVQNGGALKSGTMTEDSFTYRVNTVGKTIGLTREMLINDDLGGFVRIARNLGMSAFNTREYDFWKLVLDNASSFFSSGNGNLITDPLDIDAIALAETAMVEQTGLDGEPINVSATWLVVPPQLAATARGIYLGNGLIGASSTQPDVNIYAGVYEPKMTPYLSNTSVSSSASETAWYLWSATNKPYGIAYLNGVESPVIEETTPDSQYLGRTWRAYFDFGVCEIDHRGAVLSTGAGS